MTLLSPHDVLARLRDLPGLDLRPDEPLARHTSMGVGGPARFFAIADDEPALLATLALLRETATPWMILGGGSNTIFTDAGFPGLVLMLGRAFRTVAPGHGPDQLTAGAAATLSSVMNFAKRAGLAGFEWAAGVPGQIGGALAGNAGTPAGEICPQVDSVDVIDADLQPRTRRRGEFAFGYRTSALRQDLILRATLQLAPGDPAEIQARIDAGLKKRGEQPVGLRCSGCMFKNPPGDFAGRLIDQAGLKGLRVGAAHVSDRHANFVINEGQATAGEILALVDQIRQRVRDQFGINLEPEIRIFGDR